MLYWVCTGGETLSIIGFYSIFLLIKAHILEIDLDFILRFYMTLYILDIIHGKIQTHTIHISSVIVDQIIANLEHRLTWKVASLFSNLAHVKSVTK